MDRRDTTMVTAQHRKGRATWTAALGFFALVSCGTEEPAGEQASGECATFDSTFEAIQTVVFERRGCTAAACHGKAQSGGLDLRPGVAYENLVDAPSEGSGLARIQPGTAKASYLYQKLAAATFPDEDLGIAGSPMPNGGEPLTPDELLAIRLWIEKGASEEGSVGVQGSSDEFASLLDACLPPAAPIIVKPLEPPAPDEGIQIVPPTYVLAGQSEVEHCTPFYYDASAQVPAEYRDDERNVLFVNGTRVRQDAQSHHLVLYDVPGDDATFTEATFAGWTCREGDRDGESCNPLAGVACGAGVCRGPSEPGPCLAIMLSPSREFPRQLANTQGTQQYVKPIEGVFWEIPLKGILYIDSHAFNLTDEETTLHARVNFYYTADRRRELLAVNDYSHLTIAAGQAPFTRDTYCATHVVPQGASMTLLTGHTHRRGEHFWVTAPGGDRIYESFVYSDPLYKEFDPWMTFDSSDPAERTLEYCATYNNGLREDGSRDLGLVTRASTMPELTSCVPVACAAGNVGAACAMNSDCDSAPGAGDGWCDACAITGGTTTENEMFVLMPWYALPEVPR